MHKTKGLQNDEFISRLVHYCKSEIHTISETTFTVLTTKVALNCTVIIIQIGLRYNNSSSPAKQW